MNLTKKQFAKRFAEVFNRTPHRWMIEGRASIIHYEITATRKPLKLISIENNFISIPHFTRFCKKELGKTPQKLRDEVIASLKD